MQTMTGGRKPKDVSHCPRVIKEKKALHDVAFVLSVSLAYSAFFNQL